VAAARSLDLAQVDDLIDQHIESWIGRRYVNVLELNLALDEMTS
jgi:K+-transporting ATPase c subunit